MSKSNQRQPSASSASHQLWSDQWGL